MHEGISDHNYAKDLLSHQLLQTAFTQNIDGVLFYGTEKKKWASFQESQSEYSMSAFNYGVGAINTWVLLCSVIHGWLFRKYNSQKLAI